MLGIRFRIESNRYYLLTWKYLCFYMVWSVQFRQHHLIKYNSLEMITGCIGGVVIAQENIQQAMKHEPSDRRSMRLSISQASNNPLELVRLKVQFPQFSGNLDGQNEVVRQLLATSYTTQVQALQNLPPIDVCSRFDVQKQIKDDQEFSQRIKGTYGLAK